MKEAYMYYLLLYTYLFVKNKRAIKLRDIVKCERKASGNVVTKILKLK